MTTPQENPRAIRTPKSSVRLVEGFAALTLDPSPRLRRSRLRISHSDPVTLAWRVVGRAMVQSIQSMAQVIR